MGNEKGVVRGLPLRGNAMLRIAGGRQPCALQRTTAEMNDGRRKNGLYGFYFENTSFNGARICGRVGAATDGACGGDKNQCFNLHGRVFFTLFPLLFNSDQTFRVAAAIIQGVGFLCSGVIFKESASVRGMNTAATLWCTAAVGVLASSGRCLAAVSAAGMLIISNLLLRPLARKIKPLTAEEECEKIYRISVTCQEEAEHDLRMVLINSNSCKTMCLVNLESGDVVGDKVEIIAEYNSFGKSKNRVLEAIVGRLLSFPEVISAGWEVL